MEFWLAGGRQNPIAFTYGGAGGTNDQFRVTVYGGELWLTVNSSHSYASAQYAVALPQAWWDGNWHLFDVTYDGTTALGYMDGQLIGSFGALTPLATVTGTSPLRIGDRAEVVGSNGPYDLDEFAIYPTALTPEQIDAHWSLGGSAAGVCVAAPTSPYAQSVVKDSPSVYFRLGDLVSDSTHYVAHDSSGHCTTEAPTNGAIVPANTYPGLPHGALAAGDDGAIQSNSVAVTQSGTTLPSGNGARSMEFWLAGGRQNPIAFTYGGAGGTNDQFRVTVYGGELWLTVNSSHSYASAQYAVALPQAWWDGNWHLFDVTYDGTTALGYMDGQLIGSFGALTPLATVTGTSPLRIGDRAEVVGSNGPYDLDEFAIYPTALTPEQIDAHWTIGEPVPSVTSISPTTGPATGGTTVEIKGTGFVAGASVSFGGTASPDTTVVSPTEIRAVSPPGSGTVDIQVRTGGGTSPAVSADNYSYVAVPTAAILSLSPGPAIVGQSANLTATVSPTDGGGKVSFYADGSSKPIGQCGAQSLTPAAGKYVAKCAAAQFGQGTHTIRAAYSGDRTYAPSAGATTMAVVGVPTTLTVTSSSSPVQSGQTVTFAASVTPSDGGGTVAFYADGSLRPIPGCGSQTLSRVTVAYSATCTTAALEPGSHYISATYSGDSTYADSSGTLANEQTIEAVKTTASPTMALGVDPTAPSPQVSGHLKITGAPQAPTPQAATAPDTLGAFLAAPHYSRIYGGRKIRLDVTVSGSGSVSSEEAHVYRGTAHSARHSNSLIHPAKTAAHDASQVSLTLQLTKTGEAMLERHGRLTVSVRITYTPDHGKPVSVTVTPVFGYK